MKRIHTIFLFIGVLLFLVVGCDSAANSNQTSEAALAPLTLPPLSPADLDSRSLKVVATTSIIGDVVGQIGGSAIDLTVLMAPGQDPHSYEPASGDLTAAADADVIFVNGWHLEEGLIENLENVSENGLLVPVSAGITPIPFGGHEEAAETGRESADPHVWLDPHLVRQWTDTIREVLSALDPANAEKYAGNSAAFHGQLDQLIQSYDDRLSAIPTESRILITNHDSFGYFARAYDFDIIGTVLPGAGTLAEPSANDLAQLVDTMASAQICTIFAETTANTDLAETAAAELSACDTVDVVQLYTGALGTPGSGADSYMGMMLANLDRLVAGLQ